MTKYLIIIIGLISSLGCKDKESVITIVDIGHLDRNGIAQQLTIINKYSPKVVGLDFLLTTDSLLKDIPLSQALSKLKNVVESSKLHNKDEGSIDKWDSLERYHPKFRFNNHGFSNITIDDDSVIVSELPMRQYYGNQPVYAFSYMVAKMYNDGHVNSKYENSNQDIDFAKGVIGRYFKIISIKDLMAENFDKKDFTEKIVLMGHVSDKEDSFYLDEKRTKRISGVEIQASFINAILN
ncbi:MAG: CHASE2 domain-containing protein [Cyclobacteriaceae bacterium]|nr:CHASE2 domain-containing protein [Cyclobacteriaceae bacterium]